MPLQHDQIEERSTRFSPEERDRIAEHLPAAQKEKFHLEERNGGIYSLRYEETGRFLHVDRDGQLLNQKAESISKEAAISHVTNQPAHRHEQEKEHQPQGLSFGI